MDWSQEEKDLLLKNVLAMVGSQFSYSVLKARIKWEQLDLEGRSAKECENMFYMLTSKVRKYRLFSEIIEEAQADVQKGCSYKYCRDTFPDFPKKPLAATSQFCKDHREECQGASGTNLMRTLMQKWKECPEEEKERYKKKFFKKMKKYRKKLEEFKKNHPNVLLQGSASSSKPQPQVRAPVLRSAVSIYVEHSLAKVQEKHPQLTSQELRKKCAAKYHKLSEKKKLKWILQAQEQMAEYKNQYEAYREAKPDAKIKPAVLPLSKEEKKILDTHEGKPEVPPQNIFRYFTNIHQKEVASLSFSERSKELAKKYKQLSEEERTELKGEYEQIVQTYVEDFTSYYEALGPEKQAREQSTFEGLSHYKRILEPKSVKHKVTDQSAKKAKSISNSEVLSSDEFEAAPVTRAKSSRPARGKKAAGKAAKASTPQQDSSSEEIEKNPPVPVSPKKTRKAKPSKPQDSSQEVGNDAGAVTPKQEVDIADDSDDIDDSLLSFSSPAVKKEKSAVGNGTLDDENEIDASQPSVSSAAAETKKKKEKTPKRKAASSSNSQEEQQKPKKRKKSSHSEAEVDDALVSFFSPLRKPESPSSGGESKSSPKRKSRKKLMNSSSFSLF